MHTNQGGRTRFHLPAKVAPDIEFINEVEVQFDVLPAKKDFVDDCQYTIKNGK